MLTTKKQKMKKDTKRSPFALLVFLAISFIPALAGAFFRPGMWYEGLVKPPLNPPGWIFGPVWTFLYITIALSGWLVWPTRERARVLGPMAVFGIQILFNGLWTLIFFGLKNPGLAFADILMLWAAILWTIVLFWRRSRYAGLLLIPYIFWVSFAVYLNFGLWRLNSATP